MKPPYYLYLMHSKVVDLEELYIGDELHFQIYREKLKIYYLALILLFQLVIAITMSHSDKFCSVTAITDIV